MKGSILEECHKEMIDNDNRIIKKSIKELFIKIEINDVAINKINIFKIFFKKMFYFNIKSNYESKIMFSFFILFLILIFCFILNSFLGVLVLLSIVILIVIGLLSFMKNPYIAKKKELIYINKSTNTTLNKLILELKTYKDKESGFYTLGQVCDMGFKYEDSNDYYIYIDNKNIEHFIYKNSKICSSKDILFHEKASYYFNACIYSYINKDGMYVLMKDAIEIFRANRCISVIREYPTSKWVYRYDNDNGQTVGYYFE